ncbi:MAG: O-antigen ligase family protein [Planctomycetota bacterium]
MANSASSIASLRSQLTAQPHSSSFDWLAGPILCMWMLIFTTFTPTSRDNPNFSASLDIFSFAKLAARAGSFALLSLQIVLIPDSRRTSRIRLNLVPFVIFLLWALCTCSWSALLTISVFQTISLLVLVQLAYVIGCLADDTEKITRCLKHMTLALFLYSLVLSIPFLINTGAVDRFAFDFAHPTTAGSTASIGLLTTVGAAVVWKTRWSLALILPAAAVHGGIMFAAYNRTALVIAAIAIAVVAILQLERFLLGVAMLSMATLYTAWVLFDPAMELVQKVGGNSLQFLMRNQSSSEIADYSGRGELWAVMWESWQESPIIGHGYFVTSSTGGLDIWGRVNNYTAHNFFLQALCTTGVVGLSILFLASVPLLATLLKSRLGSTAERRVAAFCGSCFVWHLLWALPNSGFLGPIAPLSVAFFVVVGLLLSGIECDGSATDESLAIVERSPLR